MLTVRYASFYFEDALRRLMQLKARWLPWHTETSPEDPLNAMIRLEAYRMHREGCLDDHATSEQYWLTMALRASAVAQCRITGYRIHSDIPGRARILARVSSLPTLPADLVPEGAQVATLGSEDDPTVVVEADAAINVAAATVETYWDATTHTFYIGHRSMMFDAFAFTAGTYAVGEVYCTEYWDADAPVSQTVFGEWTTFALTDGSAGQTKAGTLAWDVDGMFDEADDGSHLRRWDRTTINGIEAYWVRLRRTATGSIALATPAAVHTGDWFVNFACTQGQAVTEVIGRTTTEPWQSFPLSRTPYVDGSLTAVRFGSDTTWVAVDDFALSGPSDKVYVLRELPAGVFVVCGDGINGRIPPDANDVEADYRFGAGDDGNVGAGTLTVNASGIPYLADFRNPQPATGWVAAEGSTEASMNRLRELVPADLRALGRAVTSEDYETLAVRWRTTDGRKPVARAYAIENGAGLRTVRLLVLGPNGALLTPDDLVALQAYFDGVRVGTQRRGGVGIGNTSTVVENFTLTTIDTTTTILVSRRLASGAKAAAEAAVAAKLQPLAVDADGVTYLWAPGGAVSDNHIRAAIVAAVPGFVDFGTFVTVPASPIVLGERNLAWPGTTTVTVQEVA